MHKAPCVCRYTYLYPIELTNVLPFFSPRQFPEPTHWTTRKDTRASMQEEGKMTCIKQHTSNSVITY